MDIVNPGFKHTSIEAAPGKLTGLKFCVFAILAAYCRKQRIRRGLGAARTTTGVLSGRPFGHFQVADADELFSVAITLVLVLVYRLIYRPLTLEKSRPTSRRLFCDDGDDPPQGDFGPQKKKKRFGGVTSQERFVWNFFFLLLLNDSSTHSIT